MIVGGVHLLVRAAGAKNIPAIMCLLRAGAIGESNFLGHDFLEVLHRNGMSEQIPEISDFMMRTKIDLRKTELIKESERPAAVVNIANDGQIVDAHPRRVTRNEIL